MAETLVGWEATGSGATRIEVVLDGTRATLHLHGRWMGQAETALVLDCEHRIVGSHAGVLVVRGARCGDTRVPLPPSDGPVWLEYVRVPPQPAEVGSETLVAGHAQVPDTFTHVLWLHRYSYFDDGTQLPADAYEVPVEQWRPVVEVLRQFESPWKLSPETES